MQHDAFITHAGEDKDFARPLADALEEEHLDVWFDEFILKPGDSLRQTIDRGLRESRFAVVVFSKAFFDKAWPNWELDGLVGRQNRDGYPVIIPVWHGVTERDVAGYSPSLAGLWAAQSSDGMAAVVSGILRTIRPQGSTLLTARNHLRSLGLNPPPVTDDWWLDVAASSELNEQEGSFQESMGWGRWGFPLPPRGSEPATRGLRLAWAAAQLTWQQQAEAIPITQITPERVLRFISAQPGLVEACHAYPDYLAAYAPQLLIPGFGGEFEEDFKLLTNGLRREGRNQNTRLPLWNGAHKVGSTPTLRRARSHSGPRVRRLQALNRGVPLRAGSAQRAARDVFRERRLRYLATVAGE